MGGIISGDKGAGGGSRGIGGHRMTCGMRRESGGRPHGARLDRGKK